MTSGEGHMSVHARYASVFEVSPVENDENSAALDRALHEFVAAPTTVRIDAKWKEQPVLTYTDYDTRVVVVCRPDGAFWTTFVLRPEQCWHLWHDHVLHGP